jgi:hypothetical protein
MKSPLAVALTTLGALSTFARLPAASCTFVVK